MAAKAAIKPKAKPGDQIIKRAASSVFFFCILGLILAASSCKSDNSGPADREYYNIDLTLFYDPLSLSVIEPNPENLAASLPGRLNEVHDLSLDENSVRAEDQTIESFQGIFEIGEKGNIYLLDGDALMTRHLNDGAPVFLSILLRQEPNIVDITFRRRLISASIQILLAELPSEPVSQIDQDQPSPPAPLVNQRLRLPDLLHSGSRSRTAHLDVTYEMVLNLPYDPAVRSLVGLGSDGKIINLVQRLIDEPRMILKAELRGNQILVESASALGVQSGSEADHFFNVDPQGNIFLNEGAAPSLITRALDDDTPISLSLYLREESNPPEKYPLVFTAVHISLLRKNDSFFKGTSPQWKTVFPASRNSFGRVSSANTGLQGKLRYELTGDHYPLIIHPHSGRLGVLSVGAYLLFPENEQEAARGYQQHIIGYGNRYRPYKYIYTYSLPRRTIKVAITDEANVRVEKDVDILPALPSEGCDDLPDFENDPDRAFYNWACKNTRPIPPKDTDGNRVTFATTPAYTNSLPEGMLYDRSKYKLVFADEFTTQEANTDYPGTTHLNGNLWEVVGNCPEGLSLRNGNLHFTTGGFCGTRPVGISALGKFEYRYGYLEIRMTRVMDNIMDYDEAKDEMKYRSLNIASGGRFHREGIPRTYMPFPNYNHYFCPGASEREPIHNRRILQVAGIENSIFEYRTDNSGGSAWYVLFYGRDLCEGRLIVNNIDYVQGTNGFISDSAGVDQAGRAYTLGIEWTPQGYYYFKNGRHFKPSWIRPLTYFRWAVDHSPESLKIFAHVNVGPQNTSLQNPSRTIIDYVRIYQPDNNYEGVERVFE